MSLVDIAKCIKNSKESDSVKNDVHALLNGEIEQLQTETGAGGEKETRIKEEAALVSLLYSKKDAIDRIEEMLPIKLDRAGKEISEVMNWEERTQVYVDETRKNTALQFLEMMDAESIKKNIDCLGELIADTQIKQCLAGKGIKV